MSQLVLPHTIDAGTEIVAAEHQANYVAIRDLVNGNLEGGSGASSNLKANGVTARELADTLLAQGLPGANYQEGVVAAGDLKVTPGAGLNLNVASGTAWIRDDAGLLAAGALLPATITGGTVAVPSNASGNPRIDQIIATLTDYNIAMVSVLQGTATVGADLNNRTGAAALPNNAVRLADILVPNGFVGPFVQTTHIRDRRPWSRGALSVKTRTTNLVFDTIPDALPELATRLECSGAPVDVSLSASGAFSGAGANGMRVGLKMDGVEQLPPGVQARLAGSPTWLFQARWSFTPPSGSHLFTFEANTDAGSADLVQPITGRLQEATAQLAENSGA